MCRPRYFHWRILKHDQRRINTNSTQSPPENNNDGALFIHFISIILILKPGKGSKKKLQINIPHEYKRNILYKLLVNWIQHYVETIIHPDHVDQIPGMPEWFHNHRSINVMQRINRLIQRNHILWMYAENACDKIQRRLLIKTLREDNDRGRISLLASDI